MPYGLKSGQYRYYRRLQKAQRVSSQRAIVPYPPRTPRFNPRLSIAQYTYGQHKHVIGVDPEQFGDLSLSATNGTGEGYNFTFDMIPNWANTYANIYDQVRMDMVEITFIPSWDIVQPAPGANTIPRVILFGAVDKTSSDAPSGVGTITQYANHKYSKGTLTFRFRPQLSVVQDDTVTADPRVMVKNRDGWLSTDIANHDTVPHNGVRVWADYHWTGQLDVYPKYRIVAKIYFTGKYQN